MRRIADLAVLAMILSACAPVGPTTADRIQLAVEATLTALPTSTQVPASTKAPTPTPIPLGGVFCEYGFCIGHPAGLPFYDIVAKQNPGSATSSSYDEGIVAGSNSSLFIEVMWQTAPAGSDPQLIMNVILDARVDTRSGDAEPISSQTISATYVPIQTTASSILPFGGSATWSCQGRAFAWKAYAPQPESAKSLLLDALQLFRCQ